jgi:hypothetical protein
MRLLMKILNAFLWLESDSIPLYVPNSLWPSYQILLWMVSFPHFHYINPADRDRALPCPSNPTSLVSSHIPCQPAYITGLHPCPDHCYPKLKLVHSSRMLVSTSTITNALLFLSLFWNYENITTNHQIVQLVFLF